MDRNRIAQAHNPLSPRLVFRQLTGREEVSRLFEWQLELLAENNANVKPEDLLGRDITIELQTQTKGSRFLNGQVTRFAFVGKEVAEDTDLWRYEARLSPWLWYLTRESDFRIFQNKKVPDILDEIFGKYPFQVEKRLNGSYRQWEYCVQYQETDFNFVSRLMEEEGIFYYFEHAMGRHTLVLCDDVSVLTPCPDGYGSIPYIPHDRVVIADEECVDDVRSWQQVESGMFVTDDFDFQKPSAELMRRRMEVVEHPHGDHAQYHWPGGYAELDDGDNYARVHLEELQMPRETVLFQTNARGVAAGRLFTLKNCPRKDLNREYMIVATSFYIRDNPYHSGGEGGGSQWRFGVTAQPTSLPYRPLRITPKPLTSGPQTAIVVGPRGEEIHTDKYGRVKVQFHWDQYGQADEHSSCFIRVSHQWAGANWGSIYIPRIGQEVIVDFIGGDPDQPIITGRVYNAEHMPPYELPKYQTYSTVKSRSTKNGGSMDFNELRFVDTKGKEQVFIHANWRMDVRVKWKMYTTVRESYHLLVGGAYLRTCGETNIHTNGAVHEATEKKIGTWSGEAHQIVAKSDFQVTAKEGKLELDAPDITIEAKRRITLRVGASTVVLTAGGVQIDGPMVRINSGGSGPSVTPYSFDGPQDAAEADSGEPGYLDRPRRAGGGGRRQYTGGDVKTDPRLGAVTGGINPTNSAVNCGYLIDAAIARLNGTDANAVAPADRDGSDAEVERRLDTTLQPVNSFDAAFQQVEAGGPGTTAIIAIDYQPPGSGGHWVTITNQDGHAAIIEGQDWGGNDPPEVITDPARANQRYGNDSKLQIGVIPSPASATP